MKRALKWMVAGVLGAMVLAVCVLVPVGVSYGWFSGDDRTKNPVETGTVGLVVSVSFGATAAVPDAGGLIAVNVTDPASTQRPEALTVTVTVDAHIDCVLRVKVQNLWVHTTGSGSNQVVTYPRLDTMKFDNGPDFVNNVAVDGSYYFYRAASHTVTAGTSSTLTVLSGVTEAQKTVVYEPGTTLYLAVKAEAVQANRWRELWNLDALPVPA